MMKRIIKNQLLLVIILYIGCSYYMNIVDTTFGLLMIFSVSAIAVYIHELGHYLAAKSFGYTPKYFIAGVQGNMGLNYINGLIKFNKFGTHFILNPFAQSGSVETFTYMFIKPRFNMTIISLAGPLANFAFCCLVLVLNYEFLNNCYQLGFFDTFSTTNNGYWLSTIIFTLATNFVYFFLNLFPFKNGLDGWFIWQLFKNERSPDFYNINIHKDVEKELCDEKSFTEIIEPIYDSYTEN